MVARKLDPTAGRVCFCLFFQMVMNLEKRTTEMSLEGPKMVEKGMGSPEMAEKHKNPATQGSGSHRVRWPDSGWAGYGWP